MWSVQQVVMLWCLLGVIVAKPSLEVSEEFMDSDVSGKSADTRESVESEEYPEHLETDVTIDDCKPGCPRIFDPICAMDENDQEDFRYFHNMCLMEYDRCRRGKAWKPTQMLQCLTNVDPALRDDCLRACPFIYDPVCASNGEYVEVFGNQCIFGMENCLASGKWSVVRGEVCGL